jgi:hypothetical protein
MDGWPHLRIEEGDLGLYFNGHPQNLGLLLGASGVVDVDLDCEEARALGGHFLPPTCTFGRESAPRSHFLYRTTERRHTRKFQVGRETLVEYRDTSQEGTPHQTVIPPSVHPSGELVRFYDEGPPVEIEAGELEARVVRLAAACVFARRWPREEGVRHDAAMAAGSVLIRSGLSEDEAVRFVGVVASYAGDPEVEDREEAVRATATTLRRGGRVTGAPRLKELLCRNDEDARALSKALEWLGFSERAEAESDAPDGAPASKEPTPEKGERKNQATDLVEIAIASGLVLFHDAEGTPYASFTVDDHRETHRLRYKPTRRWLAHAYYQERGRAPGAQALDDALGVLEGRALFDGPEYRTAVRVAEVDTDAGPVVYLDLGDETWRVIRVSAEGWRVVEAAECPVRFERRRGLLALPVPESGGCADDFLALLNLDPEGPDLTLLLAWLVQALRGRGPYPILAITGEQGSGKSTAARILRALLDPNTAALRSPPRSEHDAFIAAESAHVQAFDNVSGIPDWLSDVMCRLSTGGGFAVRELYTSDEERIFDATRPQLVNGITDIVQRPDLAERTLSIHLRRISDDERRTEADLFAALEARRPGLLGYLLDAVAGGLKRLPHVEIEQKPRMADFAVWATACEGALGLPDEAFLDAYKRGRAAMVEATVDGDPIAEAVMELAEARAESADEFKGFRGKSSDLLALLTEKRYKDQRPPRDWPSRPNVLSQRLKRLAPSLRALGVSVEFYRASGTLRVIEVIKTKNEDA